MKEFSKLCKEFEEMDVLSYSMILGKKALKVIPTLSAITDDGLNGVTIFATFVMGAIAADGRLSEEEYMICYPLLYAFFGDEVNYDECKKAVRLLKPEQLSDELKEDIIIICMLICSIDGKISLKEKNWIKKLLK